MLKKNAPYFLILLFLLAVLPKFFNPINGLDAAWNYSNATNLSGDLYNPYTNNIVSNLYCYTQSFVAFGVSNQYGSILFHSLVLLGFLLVIYGELGFTNKAFFLGLIVVSSYYFKLHRSEHVTLLIALILYQASFKHAAAFTRILLISIIVFTLHPVHGLLTFVGLLAYEQSILKNIKQLILLGIVALLGLVAIHYLIPENTYSNSLILRINHIGITPLFTFLKHGALTLAALLLLTIKKWNMSFTVHLLALFVLITLFGTANYYVFLLLPLLLVAINENDIVHQKPILAGLIVVSALINIVHPILIQLENPHYAQTSRAIVQQNKEVAVRFKLGKIFTENYFAPPLFKNSESRMMLVDKEQVLLVDTISKGDILLTYFKSKPQQIIEHLGNNYPEFTYEVIESIPAIDGNLTLTSYYKKRTDSLGLWVIRVK